VAEKEKKGGKVGVGRRDALGRKRREVVLRGRGELSRSGEKEGEMELGRMKGWAGGGKQADGELGCGLEERRGERGLGRFCFFINFCFKPFQTINSFQSLKTSNLLQVFKLF
jgi:hypothetical protein